MRTRTLSVVPKVATALLLFGGFLSMSPTALAVTKGCTTTGGGAHCTFTCDSGDYLYVSGDWPWNHYHKAVALCGGAKAKCGYNWGGCGPSKSSTTSSSDTGGDCYTSGSDARDRATCGAKQGTSGTAEGNADDAAMSLGLMFWSTADGHGCGGVAFDPCDTEGSDTDPWDGDVNKLPGIPKE